MILRLKSLLAGLLAIFLIVGLTSCGDPPSELTDDKKNQNTSGSSPCDPGVAGTDSDGDNVTDACEVRRGTDPNNPDTDGDGVPDDRDDLPNPGDVSPEEMAFWQQALMAAIAPSLGLANQAWTQSALPGHTAFVNTQLLIFGPLSKVTDIKFSSTLQNDKVCEDPKSMTFLAEGTMDGQPVKIELCTTLGTALLTGYTTEPISVAEVLIINRWTAAATKSGRFSPAVLSTPTVTFAHKFKSITILDRKSVCQKDESDKPTTVCLYDNLKTDYESNFSAAVKGAIKYGFPSYYNEPIAVETKRVSRSWHRPSTPAAEEQIKYSNDFLGVWVSN